MWIFIDCCEEVPSIVLLLLLCNSTHEDYRVHLDVNGSVGGIAQSSPWTHTDSPKIILCGCRKWMMMKCGTCRTDPVSFYLHQTRWFKLQPVLLCWSNNQMYTHLPALCPRPSFLCTYLQRTKYESFSHMGSYHWLRQNYGEAVALLGGIRNNTARRTSWMTTVPHPSPFSHFPSLSRMSIRPSILTGVLFKPSHAWL